MATYQEVLSALAPKEKPALTSEIARNLGVKPNDVATPLKRLCARGWATVDENMAYAITEEERSHLTVLTSEEDSYNEEAMKGTIEGFVKGMYALSKEGKSRPSVLIIFAQF